MVRVLTNDADHEDLFDCVTEKTTTCLVHVHENHLTAPVAHENLYTELLSPA